MKLSAILIPVSEGGYAAFNHETGTATQGETVEEALTNLAEATRLYLEEFPMAIIPCIADNLPDFQICLKSLFIGNGCDLEAGKTWFLHCAIAR